MKLAIFLAEGFEEIEALAVVDICRRCGLQIDMVSITGDKQVKGAHEIVVETDKVYDELAFEEYKGLILPGGGLGTRNLEACDRLMEQVDAFYAAGKCVAAICAAPSILGHRGILRGKRACCFPGFESHLEGAVIGEGPVEIAENVITSKGMGTAIDFGLAIAGVFCGQEQAEQMARTICYRA